MENTFERILCSLPHGIEPLPDIPENSKMGFYQGEFYLKNKTFELKAEGRIYYSFEGKDRIVVEGLLNTDDIDFNKWVSSAVNISSRELSGKAVLTKLSIPYSNKPSFVGIVEQIKFGGKQGYHDKWKWSYLNIPYIHGTAIRNGDRLERGRLTFLNGYYRIIIDNRSDLAKISQSRGGNKYISHYCELERIDGKSIKEEDAFRLIFTFSQFIGFVFGRRQGPFFIQGLNKEGSLQTSYHKLYEDDSLANVDNWNPYPYEEDITQLWDAFIDASVSKTGQRDILNTAIHWYLEANANHGMLEGAYIMAFAGLELMYNVLIGEAITNNEDMLNKLAKLLNIRDKVSPSGIANMRNQLVHYDQENRSKYALLSRDEKLSRMGMSLELLELSILYWLRYKGHYHDRLCGPCYRGDNVFLVPWVDLNSGK